MKSANAREQAREQGGQLATEAMRRANKRYCSKTRQFLLRLRKEKDKEIIDKLDSVDNKVDYMRSLISADIEAREQGEDKEKIEDKNKSDTELDARARANRREQDTRANKREQARTSGNAI